MHFYFLIHDDFINKSILRLGSNHLMGDTSATESKFKEDHLVLPVATPLPQHSHNAIKSGYQHDVLNSGHALSTADDMSSLHLAAHNRFLMGAGPGTGGGGLGPHDFAAASATNPFSIHRFLPGGGAGNLTDPKTADVVSHYDYSQLGSATPHGGSVGGQFGSHGSVHESSMYYPPPLYPVHPSSASSVHSANHL